MAFFLAAAVAAAALMGNPSGKSGRDAENRGSGRGCVSIGATADSPGQWFQELRDHPLLQGLTPDEMAELENTMLGFEGYGITPNVGAAIALFCRK